MRTRGKRRSWSLSIASATLGLLLTGLSAGPVQAEPVPEQWYLDAMHASEIWKSSTGRGITVALIDSGVDRSLPDLKGQVLDGVDFSKQRGDEHTDLADHGTNLSVVIAGIGATEARYGGQGLAPGAKILPIRMLDGKEVAGQDDAGTRYSQTLSRAIRYAADSKAQIINLSLARENSPGQQDVGTPELAAAVKYALSKGKLLFAGVGNSAEKSNPVQYPAATPGVVGVGAADDHAQVADFSERGPQVDMIAPGVRLVYPCRGGTMICDGDGTSLASAVASASAALIWAKHPEWTNNQVLRVMLNTLNKPADGSKRNDFIGYGGIRTRAALKSPGDPGPPNEYPLPDLAAAATKSPSLKAPKPTSPAKHENAAPKTSESGNTLLWTGVGVAAALMVGAAVAVTVLRSRRRTAATPPPPPAHPPYVPTQSPHQPPADSHQRSEQNP
ncbi:type VII secretion-associated serine protease mycosin [Streptomyces sp. NPDC001009]